MQRTKDITLVDQNRVTRMKRCLVKDFCNKMNQAENLNDSLPNVFITNLELNCQRSNFMLGGNFLKIFM